MSVQPAASFSCTIIRDSRWGVVLAAFAAVLLVALLALSPNYRWESDKGDTPYGSDFLQDWTGANMILSGSGASLYDAATFDAWQHAPEHIGFTWNPAAYYPTVYPPPHYLLFGALGWLDYRWAVPLWLALLVWCLWATAWMVERSLQHSLGQTNEPRVGGLTPTWIWPLMLLSPPLLLSLSMGQKGALWLLIWGATYCLLHSQRPWLAGFVFGALSLKPTLFFLFPLWMLWQGQWRFVLAAGLSWGGLWLASASLLPTNVWLDYLDIARGMGSYQQHAGYQLDWACNLWSLRPVVQSANWLAWSALGCLVFVAGLLVWRLAVRFPEASAPAWTGPAYAAPSYTASTLPDARQLAHIMLATCLLSPHYYAYDLVVLLLPIRLLWAQEKPGPGQAVWLLAAIWGGMTASQFFVQVTGWPLLPWLLLGAFYSLSAVTPGQSSVRNGVSGKPAPSNMLHTGLSPQA